MTRSIRAVDPQCADALSLLHAAAREARAGVLRLETGNRQQPAIALYEAAGFMRIPAWAEHADDPTSVCFEKRLD